MKFNAWIVLGSSCLIFLVAVVGIIASIYPAFGTGVNNLGNFLMGVAAIVGVIGGLFEFSSWKKQRVLEKKSEIAEKAIECLAIFEYEFDKLASKHNWVFNIDAEDAMKAYAKFSEDEKAKLESNPYEIKNYVRQVDELNKNLGQLKALSLKLENAELKAHIERLVQTPRNLINAISNFHSIYKEIRLRGFEELSSILDTTSECISEIIKELTKYLMFRA